MQLQSLLLPSVFFFLLGMLAQLVRSDLKMPPELVKSLTVYLLIGIGIHGGQELSHASYDEALPALMVALGLGVVIPVIAYQLIWRLSNLDKLNAVAIAAHYGSVSAGTFLTAIAFLDAMQMSYEKYPVMMLAVMESPAILIGLYLANHVRHSMHSEADMTLSTRRSILHESLTNGSIVLLLGSMLIGDIVPEKNLQSVLPFFQQMFMGVLCLFLLAMGIEAGKKLSDFKSAGLFLVSFGILMPLLLGAVGVTLGHTLLGYSNGGSMLVGVLAASASYIAVPPAMRIAIPEANPSLYLTLSLGITFPFNVVIGIPTYFYFAQQL